MQLLHNFLCVCVMHIELECGPDTGNTATGQMIREVEKMKLSFVPPFSHEYVTVLYSVTFT